MKLRTKESFKIYLSIQLHFQLVSDKELPTWDDYYRDNKAEEMPWFEKDLDQDVAKMINSMGLDSGKFLDLGTGPGTQAMQLTGLGFDAVGSDLSQHAITRAQKLYPKTGYVVDDILDSKFKDDEFDFILDRGVFHIFKEETIMALYLVQHGQSLPKDVDPDQDLSEEGIAETERIAGVAKNYQIYVGQIWHSVKTRARKTAEIFSSALNPPEGIKEVQGLKPMEDVAPSLPPFDLTPAPCWLAICRLWNE